MIAACLGWIFLFRNEPNDLTKTFETLRTIIFSLVVLIGIVEKLSGIANMITSEREWLPALASDSDSNSLTDLNAVMRRIDLICKLVAPLVIAGVISISSTTTGAIIVAGSSLLSWGIEIISARYVWRHSPALRLRSNEVPREAGPASVTGRVSLLQVTTNLARAQLRNLEAYFGASVWAPSFALSLLHLSALSYAATFLTYLVNSGFSIPTITIARTLGSAVEVSSTYLAPVGVRFLTRIKARGGYRQVSLQEVREDEPEPINKDVTVGLARTGLWGVCLQSTSLVRIWT